MIKTWLFCFIVDNKIISGIENTIMETDWKTPTDFQYTFGCQGLETRRHSIASLNIIDA